MNEHEIPVLAGLASTTLFVASTLPMLAKARRTRDLSSYSLGNLLLANTGNAIHSVYVFSLPPGPIWALHAFYLASTATMLVWFLRYAMGGFTHARSARMSRQPEAAGRPALLASSAHGTPGGVTWTPSTSRP
ncbi:MAG: hypothetical protein ACTHKG_18635 [Nocardioides sp.]